MAERVKCELCNIEFKNTDGLAQHQAAKHSSQHQTHIKHNSSSIELPSYSGKKTYLIILGVFILITLIWFFKSSLQEELTVNMTIAVGSDRPTLGNPSAKVTIVEFSDFQCPYCVKFAEEIYPKLKREYIDTGKVKLIFRNYPIFQAHPNAMSAAEAALCVYQQGGNDSYFPYHEKLFANSESLTTENLKSWAKDAGYNISSCLDSHTFRTEILKDMDDGNLIGVKGTPSFAINGKFIVGILSYPELKKLLDGLL